MNDKKIAFIICTNNEIYSAECVKYIQNLEMPEGFEGEILQITDAESMTAGYNEGMYNSDAKYKIYLHHDLFIVNKDFMKCVIDIFLKNPDIGIMGVLGTDQFVLDGSYWDHWNIGQCYALNIRQGYKLCTQNMNHQEFTKAIALDGMILMTQYDIKWRDDIFQKWDFYDVSQCFEFIRQGYSVAVLRENEISCLHDCGYSKLSRYDESRENFCKEYAQYGFHFENKEAENALAEQEVFFESFTRYLDKLLKINIEDAISLVDGMYLTSPKDNRVATLKIIFDIYVRERKAGRKKLFIILGDTWKSLIDKYTIYKFMVRRIEYDVEEDAASNLYQELLEGRISLEAVEEIITHCCFNSTYILDKLKEGA